MDPNGKRLGTGAYDGKGYLIPVIVRGDLIQGMLVHLPIARTDVRPEVVDGRRRVMGVGAVARFNPAHTIILIVPGFIINEAITSPALERDDIDRHPISFAPPEPLMQAVTVLIACQRTGESMGYRHRLIHRGKKGEGQTSSSEQDHYPSRKRSLCLCASNVLSLARELIKG